MKLQNVLMIPKFFKPPHIFICEAICVNPTIFETAKKAFHLHYNINPSLILTLLLWCNFYSSESIFLVNYLIYSQLLLPHDIQFLYQPLHLLHRQRSGPSCLQEVAESEFISFTQLHPNETHSKIAITYSTRTKNGSSFTSKKHKPVYTFPTLL